MQLKNIFSSKRARKQRAKALHECMLAGALAPALYESGLALDTFDGRFEMAALHGALMMRHLREIEPDGKELAQDLYEAIFDGFDYSYRETGVGDSSISRKVRGLGERFFGLARNLDMALESNSDEGLESFVTRNGLGGQAPGALIGYLQSTDKMLARLDGEVQNPAQIKWPSP